MSASVATSVHAEGPAWPPCPTPFNLAAHVLAAGTATPDKIALAVLTPTRAQRWSYARLIAAVRGSATGLLRAGLAPGDTVLMRVGNSVDFPVLYLGAIAAGIVPVPTSAALTRAEITPMAERVAPAAILAAPGIALPDGAAPVIGPETWQAWRDLPPAEYAMGDPDRLAYMVFTSGTSASPRAVAHAHRAIWARGMMTDGWYSLCADDRMLHAGAFNWTFTLGTGLLDPWTAGATALIPADGIEPAQLPLLMARHEATLFAAAPGVFRRVLRAPIPPLPALRHGLAAGEKLPEPVRRAWQDATGTQVYEAYGMSECSTFVSGAPGVATAPGMLGPPQPGRRVAILDETGAPVPRGTPGIIAVDRTDPGLMLGYHGDPAATAAKMVGGWFLTGDRGAMDDAGQIAYLGRDDDMMNAGGYRVSPLEVEAALADLPGITEMAVTEIAVKDGVRVIAAFYTAAVDLDAAQLDCAAAERLARYKRPRAWIRLQTLPRGANGKLLRRSLADYAQADGSHSAARPDR
jgi:acyl-coenzyme A synthetase/AMP-(fatty) acid ligase